MRPNSSPCAVPIGSRQIVALPTKRRCGQEHKIQSGASDTCLISSTGVPTGKRSKTSKTVSAGFWSDNFCVGALFDTCGVRFRGIELGKMLLK